MLLAEYLEEKADIRCEFLFVAEVLMRTAIDQLRVQDYPFARTTQGEALTMLIKARNELRVAFSKNPPSAECRSFDREQVQKLRKPHDLDDQAEMLADKLEQLAEEEEFVYEALGGLPSLQSSPSNISAPSENQASSSQSGKPAEESESSDEPTQSENESTESTAGQDGENAGDESTGQPLDRRGMEERQYEIVLDAFEVQRLLADLKGLTELARTRMSESLQRAEEASGAMARGDTDGARQAAGEAGGMFRELARHVGGLHARDLVGKIGAARDLSAELAGQQRGLADRLGQQPGGQTQGQAEDGQENSGRGRGTEEGESAGTGGAGDPTDDSARLAEGGRTLQDILDALARDTEADGGLVARIAVARERAGLGALAQQTEAIRRHLRGDPAAGIEGEVRETAQRLELLAHELDAVHGAVVAPRLSQLIALEKQAVQLRQELTKQTSDTGISQWHLEAQALLQELEKAGASGAAAEALRQVMNEAGWGSGRASWGWDHVTRDVLEGPCFNPPPGYGRNLTLVSEELRREARELLLRDLMASGEEAVPPQYEKLVERYFEVLSQEKK